MKDTFDLVPTRHLPGMTLHRKPNRLLTSALDEDLTTVEYEQAAVQRLRYAMERSGHKHTAAQKMTMKDIDKKS